MLALSVHSFFEGLACGVEMNLTQVINICVAIVVHKCAAGTSLGVALVKTFPDDFTLVRWLVFTFAIATPLGVLIGMILAQQGEIYSIIFSSFAGGTFLYIAATEMITEEFSVSGDRWIKLFAFLVGATIITCLWFMPGS